MDAFRSHQWIVKNPDGLVILNHTTQGETWHVRIPDSPAVGNQPTEVTFINKLSIELELYWVESYFEEIYQGIVAPNKALTKQTYAGHIWLVRDSETKEEITTCFAAQNTQLIVISSRDEPARGGGKLPNINSVSFDRGALRKREVPSTPGRTGKAALLDVSGREIAVRDDRDQRELPRFEARNAPPRDQKSDILKDKAKDEKEGDRECCTIF